MEKREIVVELGRKIKDAESRGRSELSICVEGAKSGLKLLSEPTLGVLPKVPTSEMRQVIREAMQSGTSMDIYNAIYKELNKPKPMWAWYAEVNPTGRTSPTWEVRMFRYDNKGDAESNRTGAIGITHSYRNVSPLLEVPSDGKEGQNQYA